MPAPIDVRLPSLTLHTLSLYLYAPFRSYLFIHSFLTIRITIIITRATCFSSRDFSPNDESCYSIWFSSVEWWCHWRGLFSLLFFFLLLSFWSERVSVSRYFAISSAVWGFDFRALRCGSELGWRVWFWFLFYAAARGRGGSRAARGFACEQSPTHGR